VVVTEGVVRSMWKWNVGVAGALVLAFAAGPAAVLAEGVIRPGDAIELKVVGYEEELNGIYRVGADSTASIPYIGVVRVGGLAQSDLLRVIEERIWSYYINRPEVIARPIYSVTVLGWVRYPGTYEIDGGERLSALLAMAGGARDTGNIKKARISRDGAVLKKNLQKALEAGASVEDIGISSGDIVYVPGRSWWGNWQTWAVVISTVSLSVAIYDRVTK
jgi:polysaccharide export outer membrane protein